MDKRRHTDALPNQRLLLLRARLASLDVQLHEASHAPATPDRATILLCEIQRRRLANLLRSDYQPALGPVLSMVTRGGVL